MCCIVWNVHIRSQIRLESKSSLHVKNLCRKLFKWSVTEITYWIFHLLILVLNMIIIHAFERLAKEISVWNCLLLNCKNIKTSCFDCSKFCHFYVCLVIKNFNCFGSFTPSILKYSPLKLIQKSVLDAKFIKYYYAIFYWTFQ